MVEQKKFGEAWGFSTRALMIHSSGKGRRIKPWERAMCYIVRAEVLLDMNAPRRALAELHPAKELLGKGRDWPQAVLDRLEAADLRMQERKIQNDEERRKREDAKVPVTVITGFLGSGKTTLLNRILLEQHGKRIAVIENEFGEVGIDDGLVQGGSMAEEENIVEMNNGCICCTVRGDLITGLKKLVKKSRQSGRPLDAVLIETTGLADPAPVAQTFFADDFVQQNFNLDGILTLVDAKHVIEHLDEEKPEGVENEAIEQIAFADRILLNKTDLVDEATLVEVEKRIRAINEPVLLRRTTNSVVDMSFILGIQAFSLDKILEKEDTFLAEEQEHQHDNRVSSVGIDIVGEVDSEKLNKWIGWLLSEKGVDLFRSKGILAVRGMKEKFVFQAIHMLFKNANGDKWVEGEERRCKMIFIGRNLNREELTNGFMACIV